MKAVARAIGSAFFLGLSVKAVAVVPVIATPTGAPHPLLAATQLSPQLSNQLSTRVAVPARQPASFRLSAPATVEAGQDIKVEIVRESGEGGDYSFRLSFEPNDLVQSPPTDAVLTNGAANWSAQVKTSPNVEGGPTLRIFFAPEKGAPGISGPREIDVVITPKPKPPSYDVTTPSGEVARGSELQFTVVRQGGSGASQVRYEVSQDGSTIQSGALDFNDNALSQNVKVENYETCGGPLGLQLLDVTGNTSSTASLSAELPDICTPPPPPPPPRPWWWPWALIPVVLLGGWGVKRLFRRRPPQIAPPHPPGPEKEKTTPSGDLRTSFEMRGGRTRFPDGDPELRVPPIETPGRGDGP